MIHDESTPLRKVAEWGVNLCPVASIIKNCRECEKEFTINWNRQKKFCCTKCLNVFHSRKSNGSKKTYEPRPCSICEDEFVPIGARHKYCSDRCRRTATKQYNKQYNKPQKIISKKRTQGCYVYGWYESQETLPFYIGEGINNRAWEIHTNKDGRLSACEYVKQTQIKNLKIVIYRDSLTKEGARLCESLLVSIFTQLGALLTNQKESLKRKPLGESLYLQQRK